MPKAHSFLFHVDDFPTSNEVSILQVQICLCLWTDSHRSRNFVSTLCPSFLKPGQFPHTGSVAQMQPIHHVVCVCVCKYICIYVCIYIFINSYVESIKIIKFTFHNAYIHTHFILSKAVGILHQKLMCVFLKGTKAKLLSKHMYKYIYACNIQSQNFNMIWNFCLYTHIAERFHHK